MLFLSNELKCPSEGGCCNWYYVKFEACRPYLGKYALLKSGFSWHQAEMLWNITQRKYRHGGNN